MLPKAIKGRLVSTPARVELRLYSSWIISIMGPIAVIGALRLNATIMTIATFNQKNFSKRKH